MYTTLSFERFPVPPSNFNRRFYSISESGLVDAWSKWRKHDLFRNTMALKERREYDNRLPKPIGITYNIKAVFYVSIFLYLISAVQFLLEVIFISGNRMVVSSVGILANTIIHGSQRWWRGLRNTLNHINCIPIPIKLFARKDPAVLSSHGKL